jgi:hypothetical protein
MGRYWCSIGCFWCSVTGGLESCRFNLESKASGFLCEGDVGWGLEDMQGVISEVSYIYSNFAHQGRHHPFLTKHASFSMYIQHSESPALACTPSSSRSQIPSSSLTSLPHSSTRFATNLGTGTAIRHCKIEKFIPNFPRDMFS